MIRLKKRENEVIILKPLLGKLELLLSVGSIHKILKEVNEHEAYQRGLSQSPEKPEDTINQLYKDVNTWGDGGEMEITFIEKTQDKLFFDVKTCPYFELYKKIGVEKYGVAFSCCRDGAFAKGFNNKLKLRRSKTLMEGDDHCDFRYTIEKSIQ